MDIISFNPYQAPLIRQLDALKFGRDDRDDPDSQLRESCLDCQHRNTPRLYIEPAKQRVETMNKDQGHSLWKAVSLRNKLEEHLNSLLDWARNPLQANITRVQQEITGLHQDLLAYIKATNQLGTFRRLQKQLRTEENAPIENGRAKKKLSPKFIAEELVDQVNQVIIAEPLTSYQMICQIASTLVSAITQSQQILETRAAKAERLQLGKIAKKPSGEGRNNHKVRLIPGKLRIQ